MCKSVESGKVTTRSAATITAPTPSTSRTPDYSILATMTDSSPLPGSAATTTAPTPSTPRTPDYSSPVAELAAANTQRLATIPVRLSNLEV